MMSKWRPYFKRLHFGASRGSFGAQVHFCYTKRATEVTGQSRKILQLAAQKLQRESDINDGPEADSEIVIVDGTLWDDSFEQERSWNDAGTTISGIQGTHQKFYKGQDADFGNVSSS